MASPSLRRAENVAGNLFVDSTCIDCDTCRWMAPGTFDRADGMSRVHAQPGGEDDLQRALMALLSCPTGSIGTAEKTDLEGALAALPVPIEGGVHHCGYHAESSFGAASYLIVRERGNVLVDSPRFAKPLLRRVEELGGVDTMFLTHRDDVADHEKWAAHFGAERVLHAADVGPGTRGVERQLEGEEPIALDDELLVHPVPGHTEGSCCLLYDRRILFSGDHLAWGRREDHLIAFRRACWYDWGELTRSMLRLAQHDFEWVLPGHGRRCHFPAERMRREMQRCLEWMETA